jgi:hypothetical protein
LTLPESSKETSGSIYAGGSLPERVKRGEKAPEVEQPASKKEDEKKKGGS